MSGLTELVRIAAHAAAYNIDIVPLAPVTIQSTSCMSANKRTADPSTLVAYSPDGTAWLRFTGDFFVKEPLRDGWKSEESPSLISQDSALKLSPRQADIGS